MRPWRRWRSLPDHTCESFGAKLFIWFSLSATSVSSVHLCPLYKKKIHHPPTPPHPPSAENPPPKKTTRPSGRNADFPMTTNKMGSKLTHRTPSTLTPAFLQAVPVQKCAELEHKEVIQTSPPEGSAGMLGRVGLLALHLYERKTSLPAILCLFLFVVANAGDKAAIY